MTAPGAASTDPYGFDELRIERLRRRRGTKWTYYGPEVLALWIADMDFDLAPPIRRALEAIVERSDLGYPHEDEPRRLAKVFAARMGERYDWWPSTDHVRLTSDVLQGIEMALRLACRPGDGVIVQTAIYPPFLTAVETTGTRLLENPLRLDADGWRLDLDELRALAPEARVLLFCNPHNPAGRVFRRDELEAVAAIAVEHDLLVLSDEIHADLAFAGHRHIPLASLGEEIAARTVTLTSATKAFNLAGVCCAVAHIGPPELREAIDALPPHAMGRHNMVGLATTGAAWECGQPWLDALLPYLEANRDFVAAWLAENLPQVGHVPPEATYLAWLDCRPLDLPVSPFDFFLQEAKVVLHDGRRFGALGDGFVRLNFATSRHIVEAALERMKDAIDRHRGTRS